MVLSAGTLFHSDYSRFARRVQTGDDDPLTTTFKIQNLVKGRDDLILDVGMYDSKITINFRAEDRDMVSTKVSIAF